MQETILRLDNLTKHYGYIKAVSNLSFDIKRGNVYGILGPNGSGKSTTLGMILNVVNKTSGTYQWFGGKLETHQALKRVGAIIEHPNFYPYMTAYENLKLVCRIKAISFSKIEEKLAVVDLLDRKDDKFSSFSLGMKQRLAIASALINDPEILILDEPTNGLDPKGIRQIRDIINNIAKLGTTILLASHLLDEVEKVCSHVVIIRKGKMLYSGSVAAMQSNEGYFELAAENTTALQKALNEHPDIVAIKQKEKLYNAYLKNNLSASELNRFLFEKGIVVSHLAKRKESLEQLFLDLTNKNQNEA